MVNTHLTLEHKDFRQALRKIMEAQKVSDRQLSLSCKIHPAYFSRVMTGKANFSNDQVFKIGNALKLHERDIEFLMLLGDFESCADSRLKQYLSSKIEKIRTEELKLRTRFKEDQLTSARSIEVYEKYYSSTLPAKIHMLLTIPKFQADPNQISKLLGISSKLLNRVLTELEDQKLIVRKHAKISEVKETIHMEEDHPYTSKNLVNWRLELIAALQKQEPRKHEYHFSATVTVDDHCLSEIQNLIRKTLLSCKERVEKVKNPDQLWHLAIDLF